MLGVYDFCGHYEWTFDWLNREGGSELVQEYWQQAISEDSQRHAQELIAAKGLEGMVQYWGPTLQEEGGTCVVTHREDVIRLDMHDCPSKGFLLRNGLQQYDDYCDHCIGWIGPLMQRNDFKVDHQHNHCGQCWWEMRAAKDGTPLSKPGEMAGPSDIRLTASWSEGERHDSFLSATPVSNLQSATTFDPLTFHKGSIPMTSHFITALVTPLQEDDSLHVEGLERLIAQQETGGITSFLAGGSMGAMQLLPDQTYRDLMSESARIAGGELQLYAGIGDAGFARTRDRLEFVNTLPFNGVVVLTPYVMPYSQDELVDYFFALADLARAPLFLYDLPVLTRCKLEIPTVQKLAGHPNIAGIKCSDEPGYARQIRDLMREDFRVILAAPTLIDTFLRDGFIEHLDGCFCLCPDQIAEIGQAVAMGDSERAAYLQQGVNKVLRLLRKHEVWRPFTALLNELGIPGRFKPRPHRNWDEAATQAFLREQETREVLEFFHGSTVSTQVKSPSLV
jgi:dihydrodipicolinate synthase/N-acetylneuraminate lyase